MSAEMKVSGRLRPGTFLFLSLFIFLAAGRAHAAIIELQSLNFGGIAIPSNVAVSTLTLPYDGRPPSVSGSIVFLSLGSPGVYRLEAFPAYTPLIITTTGGNLTHTSNPGAEPLQMGALTHPDLTTDANGEAILDLGATLSTTGSGTPYIDGNYRGDVTITINW